MKKHIVIATILLSFTVSASVIYYGAGRAVLLENILQFANYLEIEATGIKKLKVSGEVQATNFQGANIRKNYLTIGGFELSNENFTSYIDTAAITPVDGTGGGTSTFLSCNRSVVSPIEGDGSLIVSKFNSALGGQGHGCSYDFTLDSPSFNQNLVVSFDYLWKDVDSTNGDFAVFIYDVDNATLITPSSFSLNEVDNVTNYVSAFAVTDGINYRLIVHQTLSRTGIFDLKIDNLFIGKQSKIEGVNVSSSGIASNYVLASNGAGASSWVVPPLAYSTTNEYFGVSTASQTVINLGYSVTLSNKENFQLFVDGILFNEGATYDYEFTNIVSGASDQVTLTSAIPASLTIRGLYHGAYGTSLSNPMTAEGDVIYGIAGGLPARLPIGTEGHVLTVQSGVPAWTASGAGLSNPMTTAEDMIIGGASGTPARLPVGTASQILTVNGSGEVVWADPAATFTNPMTTAGDLIKGGASGTPARIAAGTNGQILTMVAGAPAWDDETVYGDMDNPMTTAGDVIKGGASGTPERVAIGAENTVLTSKSGAPSWEVAQLDNFKGSATIANNQTSAADVTGLLLDNTKSYFAKIDYSIDRRYSGDINLSSVLTNIIDGSKFSTYGIAFNPIMYSHKDGLHFIGGSFVNYVTSGDNRLIAFNGSGTIDSTFMAAAVSGTKFNNSVSVITGHADGDLLIGGNFTNYAGTTGRNRFIKISATGVVDTAFTGYSSDSAKIGNIPYDIKQLADGKIAIAGTFIDYGGTTGKSYLVVLNADGTEHSAFNTAITSNFNAGVYSVLEISAGKLLVMGAFTAYAGTANRSYAIVLNTVDGSVDTTLTAAISDSATKFNNAVYTGIKTPDNGFVVGGVFTNYGSTTNRSRLVKFKSDGSLDIAFTNLASDGALFNNQVSSIYQTYLNRIVVLGNFLAATQPYYGRYGVTILDKNGTEPRDVAAPFSYGFRFGSGGFWSYETPCGKTFLGVNASNIDGVSGRNFHVAHAEDGSFVEKPYREGTVYAYYNTATSAWEISKDNYQGESRGVTLSITSAGQVQFTSNRRTGTATANTLKFFVKYL